MIIIKGIKKGYLKIKIVGYAETITCRARARGEGEGDRMLGGYHRILTSYGSDSVKLMLSRIFCCAVLYFIV